MAACVLGVSGWRVLLPGAFAADQFIFAYGMCFVDLGARATPSVPQEVTDGGRAVIFVGWKLVKRTKFRKASEMDFRCARGSPSHGHRLTPAQERPRQPRALRSLSPSGSQY
jgi:hypothetical protein